MQKSGKSKWVHFRWACPKFVPQTFMNGRATQFHGLTGPELATIGSASKARVITPPFEHLRSSGFEFFFVAGRIIGLMMLAITRLLAAPGCRAATYHPLPRTI